VTFVEGTLYAVKRIVERVADGEAVGHVKTVDVETDNLDVKMLAQIEGLSNEKAQEIFEEVGDINHIAWNVTDNMGDTQGIKDALREIDGVGDTLADRVIDAFQ